MISPDPHQHNPRNSKAQPGISPKQVSTSVAIEPDALPGFEQSLWQNISSRMIAHTPDFGSWSSMGLQERISAEIQAVSLLFQTRTEQYRSALLKGASTTPSMPSDQRLTFVIPSYNEGRSVGDTVRAIITSAQNSTDQFSENNVGVLVVLNRPIRTDEDRNIHDISELEASLEELNKVRDEYPEFDLQILRLEVPEPIAGVGIARMVGHDFTALRSIMRDQSLRSTPHYIHTFDADTGSVSLNYIDTVLATIHTDNYTKDFYRISPSFPINEYIRHPLLHSLHTFWYSSIRELSTLTDNPWTAGAGILVSMYAHYQSGGVFPFKFDKGVDEDLRIGVHAHNLRSEDKEAFSEICGDTFDTDPRRMIVVAGDLIQELDKSPITPEQRTIPSRYSDMATGLLTYIDFHSALLRSSSTPAQEDTAWLTHHDRTEFERALPPIAIEAIANGYRAFLHRSLRFYLAAQSVPEAKAFQHQFLSGECARAIANMRFDEFCNDSLLNGTPASQELQKIDSNAAKIADQVVEGILLNIGVDFEYQTQIEGAEKQIGDRIPRVFLVNSTGSYQKLLQQLLLQ